MTLKGNDEFDFDIQSGLRRHAEHDILEKLALLCSFHPQCDSACIGWGTNTETLYLSTDRDEGEDVASSLRSYLDALHTYLDNKATGRELFIDRAYRSCYSKLSKLAHDTIISLIIDTLSSNNLDTKLPPSDHPALHAYAVSVHDALQRFQGLLDPQDVEGNPSKFSKIHESSAEVYDLMSDEETYCAVFSKMFLSGECLSCVSVQLH